MLPTLKSTNRIIAPLCEVARPQYANVTNRAVLNNRLLIGTPKNYHNFGIVTRLAFLTPSNLPPSGTKPVVPDVSDSSAIQNIQFEHCPVKSKLMFDSERTHPYSLCKTWLNQIVHNCSPYVQPYNISQSPDEKLEFFREFLNRLDQGSLRIHQKDQDLDIQLIKASTIYAITYCDFYYSQMYRLMKDFLSLQDIPRSEKPGTSGFEVEELLTFMFKVLYQN